MFALGKKWQGVPGGHSSSDHIPNIAKGLSEERRDLNDGHLRGVGWASAGANSSWPHFVHWATNGGVGVGNGFICTLG